LLSHYTNFGNTPLSNPEPPSFRFPNPLPFTDNINDALPYITRVKFYMGINSSRFPRNSEQIYFFTQGCHGPMSRRWASMILAQNMKEREENVSQPKVATLEQVSSNFAIRFAPIEHRRTAQANLEVFKQGTMHARDYVTEFEILAEDAGYEGEALIQSFRRGLTEVIRNKIDEMRPAPNTFTEWKEEAIRRDAAFRARLVEKRAWSDHNPFRTSAPPLRNVTSTGPTQGTPNGITARAVC
jgi:hypothetical protein